FMLDHIMINSDILNDKKYDYLFTVEEVNRLVLSGIPFREAYQRVGEEVNSGKFTAEKSVNHTHAGSIGNLCTEEIRKKMDLVAVQIN
ncbi:MAG: argininosuccinate lyase, partial [Dysgonamonadaceae bacterium]